MAHLFVDVSSHGLGHLAQVAPVLNELVRIRPELRLTIRSGLPAERMRARISVPFDHHSGCSDFGFVMRDAVCIDSAATGQAYRKWHADWARRVAAEAEFLRGCKPDLVLTDVAYLPLAGAAAAGIPALSMCSLNWAGLFAHVFGHEPWATTIHDEILAAYRSAACFLRLTPAMPMPELPDARPVGPVTVRGRDSRPELHERLGSAPGERIVLIAFGGFDKDVNAALWPVMPGVRWLVPENWGLKRGDMTALESLCMDFTRLLCSVDAVLTKPGYGTFTEAACNGTPVLYVLRHDDWPEQDCLVDWLKRNARCQEVDASSLMRGDLMPALEKLWAQTPPPIPDPDGVAEAAQLIASYLP